MCMEFNIPSLDGRATQDYFSLAVVTCAYFGPYVWDGAENHDPKQLHTGVGFTSRRVKQEENHTEAIPSFPATQYVTYYEK